MKATRPLGRRGRILAALASRSRPSQATEAQSSNAQRLAEPADIPEPQEEVPVVSAIAPDAKDEESSTDSGLVDNLNLNVDVENIVGLEAGAFKEAALRAMDAKPPSKYVREEEVQLNECEDSEPWMPAKILELIGQDMSVEFIDESVEVDYNDIMNHLKKHKNAIGLTAISKTLSRFDDILMIVLTTPEKIFALTPIEKNMNILRYIVEKYKLCTSYVSELSDALYKRYGIKLNKDRTSDANCYHIALKLQVQRMPHNIQRQYNSITSLFNICKPRYEPFDTLAKIYLQTEPGTLLYNQEQLGHLKSRPLNLTAVNIIKKASVLILPLVAELHSQYMIAVRNLVESSIARYVHLSDEARQYAISNPTPEYDAMSHIASGTR